MRYPEIAFSCAQVNEFKHPFTFAQFTQKIHLLRINAIDYVPTVILIHLSNKVPIYTVTENH